MTSIRVSPKIPHEYPAVTVDIFGLPAIPEYRRLSIDNDMTPSDIDQLQPLDPAVLSTYRITVEFRKGETKAQQKAKIKAEVQLVVDARNGLDKHAGNIKAELGEYDI